MFEAHVTVNGEVISLEEGETKKIAKRCAAEEAIKELKNTLVKLIINICTDGNFWQVKIKIHAYFGQKYD